jgi:AcrR family transcriptional regulator
VASRARKRLTRDEKRLVTRARLLDAAVRVFAARGYDAATVEEIAEESGLSNGALYYNFGSKEDLFFALLDERMDRRLKDLERIFGPAQAPPTDTDADVRTATANIARDFPEPKEWALFFEFVAHAGRNAEFRRKFRSRLRQMRRVLSGIVEERAAETNSPLALPADQVAIAMQALGYGLHAQRLADPRAVPDDLFGVLLLALLRGLVEQASPPKSDMES